MWMSRWVRQPPAKVFQAWTTATLMPQWLTACAGGSAGATVNLEPSGDFTISEKGSDGVRSIVHQGTYREVWPPHTLVYTWRAPAYFDGEATVIVSLVPAEDETLVTIGVSEIGSPSTQEYWRDSLTRLQEILAAPGG